MQELHELLVDGLRDIYDAEKQLVRALPKLAKALTAMNSKNRSTLTWSKPRITSPVPKSAWNCWARR